MFLLKKNMRNKFPGESISQSVGSRGTIINNREATQWTKPHSDTSAGNDSIGHKTDPP